MINLLETLDYVSVLKEYFKIKDSIQWTDYGQKSRQAGLQYKLNEDIWQSAVGKSKGNEKDYCLLNPIIENTIFHTIINKYNLVRSRFLFLGPNSNYSMHKDDSPRIHLPIITNKQSFMVFREGLIQHLESGNLYETDTTREHTAINCSESWRLHFVGVLIDN